MPPILYLIDGHALAYRTFFAISASTSERLQTHAGEPTAGIYGFASVLMRLLEVEKPEYLAVAFDSGHSFRDVVFPAYKATRAKMPDDLRSQVERIRQMVDAFHIPRLELENYEADDVLGSIARQAVAKGFGVKIITGDRDLLQLVDDRILVNLPGKSLSEARDYNAADVMAYLGVRPDQVVDYKALVGDKSDNIPGVMGIGEKTAQTLLATYSTLDEIYAHLEDLKKGERAKLEAGRDSAYLSQKLATILTDLQISLDLERAKVSLADVSEVESLFLDLEFRTLLLNLRKLSAKSIAQPPAPNEQLRLFGEPVTQIGEAPIAPVIPRYELTVHIVDTPAALQDLTRALADANVISFDTETTSTDRMRSQLVGISLAVREGEGYYIPVGHVTGEPQLPIVQVIAALRPAMTDPSKQKVGQNLKFDSMVLERYKLHVAPLTFDTMIAAWLINPASHSVGLKEMAGSYLNASMTHIEELIGRGKTQITMAEVPVAQAAPYAAADAEIALRLMPILQQEMDEKGALRIFHEVEMPLIDVLADMERNGITLNAQILHDMSQEAALRLAKMEDELYALVGYSFNLNSTQQLSKALFETLHLAPPDRRKKTASGHFSTSADVLDEMRGQHPAIDRILEYRELSKLKSTYLDSLPLEVNPDSGRIHTSFSQTGSVTGRLASSDPNLQNIPTRSEYGRLVRGGFTAAEGYQLISVDYSQVELRILAHISGDEAMLDAFRQGQDIHATTAAAIFGVPLASVSKDMRRKAKSINFGLVYGMSAFGLSRTTGLTLGESENFVKAYFKQFPRVKEYLDGMRRTAALQGYVETLLGRRRYFPNLSGQANVNMRNREEREAINAPIQGTAADIMKLAMIALEPALKAADCPARLLLQVHDELVLEAPDAKVKSAARLVQNVMEKAYTLSIPLETEARCGKTWGAMEVMKND